MNKQEPSVENEAVVIKQSKVTNRFIKSLTKQNHDQAYYVEEIEMRDRVIEKLTEKIEQFIEVQDRNNDLFKATQASYLHEVTKNNYLEARIAELENRHKL